MRIPGLGTIGQILSVWPRFQVVYERDYQALAPSIEDLTLGANVASTTYSNRKLAPTRALSMTPKTANAAAEIGNGTLYVATPTQGQVVITHANNAQSDRTFRVAVIGT